MLMDLVRNVLTVQELTETITWLMMIKKCVRLLLIILYQKENGQDTRVQEPLYIAERLTIRRPLTQG